jgi:hypothetical protein
MPTDPAEITIYNEIKARAWNIQESNGYQSTVQDVKVSSLTPFKGGDWPKFSFWPTSQSQVDNEYGQEEHTLNIIIGYFDQTRDEPFSYMAAKMKSDVIAAMNRATSYDSDSGQGPEIGHALSHDLGGLVSGFTVGRSEPIQDEGEAPWCGVLIEVEIKYKSEMGDPFSILAE